MSTREAPRETGADEDGAEGDGDDGSWTLLVHALVATVLTAAGVILSALGSLPGFLYGLDSLTGVGVTVVGSELGFVLAALAFLLVSGRGLRYLDLALPGTRRQWGVVVGVVLGAFAFRTVVLAGALSAGVEPSVSTITEAEVPQRALLLFLVPVFLLVVGPAEELLFRGVVQKYLREVVSAPTAILGAGLLFGTIHVFALVQSTGLGTVVSVATITLVGFAFGWLYEWTGSLPAAMLAHGAYNALIAASALLLAT